MHQSLDDKSAYSVCSLTIKFNISYTLAAVKMLLYSTNFKEAYIYINRERARTRRGCSMKETSKF